MARVSPKGRAGSRTDDVLQGSDGVQPVGASGHPPKGASAAYLSVPKGSTKGGSRDRGKGGKGAKRG